MARCERDLGKEFLRIDRALPPPGDTFTAASHVALSAVHGVDYLVTWNCRHIANAVLMHRLPAICQRLELTVPVICTPAELMEDHP